MRGTYNNLVGQRFKRLTVLELAGTDKSRNRKWLCQCDCGEQKVILGIHLKSENTQSCGCLSRESSSMRNLTHGQSRKTTYRIWDAMRRRCSDPNNPGYKWYGAKGIRVCDKWQKFAGFFEDMGVRPPGLTIERRDSHGNYEKDNCEWATVTKNLRNRSCVKLSMKIAREIRKAGEVIHNNAEIGRMFGVGRELVRKVLCHDSWQEGMT